MPIEFHRKKVDVSKLSGLTLFESTKGWQLSYRLRGDTGWNVTTGIPQEKAFEMLDAFADKANTAGYHGEPLISPHSLTVPERKKRTLL